MKLYFISGEASGDLHGSNLIKELNKKQAGLEIRAWGGNLMKEQGAYLVKHYKDLAFMGFIEVVSNLKTILSNIDFCKRDIIAFNPDIIVLIDYPGFNLRIAEFAKKKGYKVVYYISPQVWAWKQNRVYKIKKVVDKMLCILPFEKEFYGKFNYSATYVGHPLLDAIYNFKEQNAISKEDFTKKYNLNDKPIIALLPGSRYQEINVKLNYMCSVVKHFNNYQFVIAGAPSINEKVYEKYLNNNVKIVYNDTYNLLNNSKVALVTSGTATLETALFRVPEVVCYKGSEISYQIAKRLIKVKYISLVNLIMNKEVVKELIQNDITEKKLVQELSRIIDDSKERQDILSDYNKLEKVLGGVGASERAAHEILLLK